MQHEQGDHGTSAGVSLCCWHKWWCSTGVVMESGVLAGWVRWFGNDTVGWSGVLEERWIGLWVVFGGW